MTDQRDVERILGDRDAFGRGVPEPHIPDEVLADLVAGTSKLRDEHLAHLASCQACRDVLGVELIGRSENISVLSWLRRPSAVAATTALAASIAFAVWMDVPRDHRSKGQAAPLSADVTIVATNAQGLERELSTGARVYLTERLGFRYGNPSGRYQTITVLGWDGQRIHWYYPAAEDEAPPAIRGGKKAMSLRLPFDVKVDDHRPGPLRIVAAFDRSPQKLASDLIRDAKLSNPGTFSIRVTLSSTASKSASFQ